VTIIGVYARMVSLLVIASALSGFSGYSLVIICYIIVRDVCEEASPATWYTSDEFDLFLRVHHILLLI
jgi:hypothetical protein